MKNRLRPFFILLLTLISASVLLLGCKGINVSPPVLDFSADIEVASDECLGKASPLSATLDCTSQGAMKLSVTTPDELSGLTYKWTDVLEISYKELICTADIEYITETCFAEAVYNVLCDLRTKEDFDTFNSGFAEYRGECPSGEYIVRTDSKGYIQDISIEELSLRVTFAYKTQT